MSLNPDTARVVNMPSELYGGFDLETTIACNAEAEPPVNRVEWKKDGVAIAIQQVGLNSIVICYENDF